MKHLKKRIISATAAICASVVLMCAHAESNEKAQENVCVPGGEIDKSLPMSHPKNKCHVESSVSWLNWFSGKSLSGQFHFFDLLELLTKDERPDPFVPQNQPVK